MYKTKLAAFAAAVACCALAATTAAQATPITYNFTVTMPAGQGPMGGTVTNGSFTYDSSSVTPGASNNATNLLTALNFVWNGVTYTAASANTGQLTFDGSGNLTYFVFGNDCVASTCYVDWGSEQWFALPGLFGYSTPGVNAFLQGNLTFSLAGASVPEPGNLALFGGGLLMLLGGVTVLRRRQFA